MGTRSLQASQKGIEKANLALAQYSLSQNALAEDLELSRQTINKFFKGKPIDRVNFALICDRLGLNLEDTVTITHAASDHHQQSDNLDLQWGDAQSPKQSSNQDSEINSLAKQVRLLQVGRRNLEEAKKALDRSSLVNQAEQRLELEFRKQEYQAKSLENDPTWQNLYKSTPPNKVQKKNLSLLDKITLLAEEIQIPSQILQQFFLGESIESEAFKEICFYLKLEWQVTVDIDFLHLLVHVLPKVKELHYYQVQNQCGSIKILDVARPVELDSLYVDVNILEEPPSYQQLELADLPRVYDSQKDEFDRLGLGQVRQVRVPGLKALSDHSKLVVLGKPGSGKSTFLKYIAIQCNQNSFQEDRIPIFFSLKNFSDDVEHSGNFGILNYILQKFSGYKDINEIEVQKLLSFGRALILLDGLDEIPENNADEVLRQIRRFFEEYHKNQFVITCRTAAYGSRFAGFTEVEVADFTQDQIEKFSEKWFRYVDKNSIEEARVKGKKFVKKLNLPENDQIREICTTPILLNLACLVFQAKADFPSNRSRLYDQGIDILLRKWDKEKKIKRDEVYRSLSIWEKMEILTQVASSTFENARYFFDKVELQLLIAQYLSTLPSSPSNQFDLLIVGEATLQSIEAQHGLLVERARHIYSFSHLTFQEYFTARSIINSFEQTSFTQRFNHITKKSWHEVFLLAASMMRNADDLIRQMKKKVDEIIGFDKDLQKFLTWLLHKSVSVKSTYKPVVVRAFYFDFARRFNPEHISVLAIDSARIRALKLPHDIGLDLLIAPSLISHCQLACSLSYEFEQAVISIRGWRLGESRLTPDSKQTEKLRDRLRDSMIQKRNVGHDWKFSYEQKALLQQYYYANQLLVNCLKSGCTVSDQLREEIEETLLMPITAINNER